MIESQRAGFEELYEAFLAFFIEQLAKDPSPWNKIRLQMMSQYFDDISLYKVINPIVVRINSNPEDRRSIARAALWSALLAHHMGNLVDMIKVNKSDNERPDSRTCVDEERPMALSPEVAAKYGLTPTEPRIVTRVVRRNGRGSRGGKTVLPV